MSKTEQALERLTRAVREDAAFRRTRRLQPVGGVGDKIFPPTYPGERNNDPPRHVFERRRVSQPDGTTKDVMCVLIDSVQSQANRLEEALRFARDAKLISFPVIAVDFAKTELADVGRISTLEAPHRVFDAIIRDSELDGKRFKDTDHGKRLLEAKASNARAVFDLSPTALLFGAWNSTGGGEMGAKFPRALVSEIIGVNVAVEIDPKSGVEKASGQQTGSRIDPLGIRSGVEVYKQPNGDWSLEPPPKGTAKGDKGLKPMRPSEINHSNIAPTVTPLGVSVDYIQHTFVLSLAALRRLRFTNSPIEGEHDVLARTVLASLGLAAAAAQNRTGYALRSRCDLVSEPQSSEVVELVHANGLADAFPVTFEEACALLTAAIEGAARRDLRWRDSDVVLKPQAKLVELVRRSRQITLEGISEDSAE